MQNLKVDDCKGKLTDSDGGNPSTNYAHNEDFTFTICVPNGKKITLSFNTFCTEAGLDTIRFFDGPDKNSPKIGPTWSGNTPPPTVVANSGCLTIHFKSDANVACFGWDADWVTEVDPPVPPLITLIEDVTCTSKKLTLTLDKAVPCDSVLASRFSINGTGAPAVVLAQPAPCTGGQTQKITLTLADRFGDNGPFTVNFLYRMKDECDEVHEFVISKGFTINDCPLTVNMYALQDTLCPGSCTQIWAKGTGGDSASYQFVWDNGLPPTAGPHTVCPNVTTTYRVILKDSTLALPDTAYHTIEVIPKPNAGPDRSFCLNAGNQTLTATPPGGIWSGPGIVNAAAGTFDPKTAGPGTHAIYYKVWQCFDTLLITVLNIEAGPDEAACPGTPAFNLSGHSPTGGTWSGPFITDANAGTFNPAVAGTYTIDYTVGGCTDSKTVRVRALTLQDTDTACQTDAPFNWYPDPFGGVWKGPGITDSLYARFDPSLAGNGNHVVYYYMHGCYDSIRVYVHGPQKGFVAVMCPEQPAQKINYPYPAGGVWSGRGITDATQGIYDPGFFKDSPGYFIDTVRYAFDGCVSTSIIYVLYTQLNVDTARLCASVDSVPLNQASTGRLPGGGKWSGPGVSGTGQNAFFVPAKSGPGWHTVYYTANTCADSIKIFVEEPLALPADTTLCMDDGLLSLNVAPGGGTWTGPGLVGTPPAQSFDPLKAGQGTHILAYRSPVGCRDTFLITVGPKLALTLYPPDSVHCHTSVPVNLQASPGGGQWKGPGVSGTQFRPSMAGEGKHVISYTVSSGACVRSDSFALRVRAPIQAQVNLVPDTPCAGELFTLSSSASGGLGGSYEFVWQPGGSKGQSITGRSDTPRTYVLTVRDYCSDDHRDTVRVVPHPDFAVVLSTSDTTCYEDPGWIKALPQGSGPYDFLWSNGATGDSVAWPAGKSIQVQITDVAQGCSKQLTVSAPARPVLKAHFIVNPGVSGCLPLDGELVELIDLSQGGTSGTWDLGNGQRFSYAPGQNPRVGFVDTGHYTITLIVLNPWNCADTTLRSLCFVPVTRVHAPDAFTPNGDGINDLFVLKPIGADEAIFRVYDRWGRLMHKESGGGPFSWDGLFQGKPMPVGVYLWQMDYRSLESNQQGTASGLITLVR